MPKNIKPQKGNGKTTDQKQVRKARQKPKRKERKVKMTKPLRLSLKSPKPMKLNAKHHHKPSFMRSVADLLLSDEFAGARKKVVDYARKHAVRRVVEGIGDAGDVLYRWYYKDGSSTLGTEIDPIESTPTSKREHKLKHKQQVSQTTTAPFSVGGIIHTPMYSNKLSGSSVVVSRTEILNLNNVVPSQYDTATAYYLNPGNSILFPWLHRIARNYELFRFTRCNLVYNPSCPTNTLGRIVAAYDPDRTDPVPSSLLELQMMGGAVGLPPWLSAELKVPRKLLSRSQTNALYVWNDDRTAPSDSNTAGVFYISGDGGDDSTVTGYWTIEYTVELDVPQLHSTTGGYLRCRCPAGPSTDSATPFDTMQVAGVGSNLQDRGVSWAGNTLTFSENAPAGCFTYVAVASCVTSLAGFSSQPAATGGITNLAGNWAMASGFRAWAYSANAGASPEGAVIMVTFSHDGSGGTIDIDAAVTAVGNWALDFRIYQLPDNFVCFTPKLGESTDPTYVFNALLARQHLEEHLNFLTEDEKHNPKPGDYLRLTDEGTGAMASYENLTEAMAQTYGTSNNVPAGYTLVKYKDSKEKSK